MQRKWSASPAVKVAMANDALRNTGATGALDMEEMAVTDGPLLPYITSLKTAGFKTFQARPIQKLSHKYVKDDRVIALCTQGSGANPLILVLPHNKPSQVKRMIPMKHVESVVAIIAEETQGLITKSTSFYTQILIRMVVGSGEKDFMFNMLDCPGADDDAFIEALKKMAAVQESRNLPVTDMRREKNAPKDLRDWLNQQGLKPSDGKRIGVAP